MAVNCTADSSSLKTWWHASGEINTNTAVLPGNVRQSHAYTVQVSTVSDMNATFYDSFVFESIPRNGNGNILDPNDPTSASNQTDGITIEQHIGLTMAWSQFLYSTAAQVKIHRISGTSCNSSDVVIRPTNLGFNVSELDGDIIVTVPWSETGAKFSVEFQDSLYDFRAACPTPTCGYIDDVGLDGALNGSKNTAQNPVVGSEPLNSLLIFASPFPQSEFVPDASPSLSHSVEPGFVSDLDTIDKGTIIFNPGVYWFSGTAHAVLHPNTTWVYLAPGAYVKGAVEFTTNSTSMVASGYGVLSGEQYVYQANTANKYTSVKSDDSSLRMWSGCSGWNEQSTFTLTGITLNAPPFNSMDFTGNLNNLSVLASDYKQVGAFFDQTDGLEMYPGSRVRDVFYHSNDDTIKTYYSNVTVDRAIVWKGNTAPVIQFGWESRNMTNVTVNDVDVIHSRWSTNASHPGLIGSNQVYEMDDNQIDTANLSNTLSYLTFSNIRAEGPSGNLFRICPLSNFQNVSILNVSIESFVDLSLGISESQLVTFTDTSGEPVSMKGFLVRGFTVAGVGVSELDQNWNTTELGNINFPASWIETNEILVD